MSLPAKRAWRDSGVVAAVAILPVAPLLLSPVMAHANSVSAVGSNIAVGIAPVYSYSYSLNQPQTSAAFNVSNVGLSASFDGGTHFGLAAATSKTYLQSTDVSQVHVVYSTSVVNATAVSMEAFYNFSISTLGFSLKDDTIPGVTETFAARIYRDAATTPLWSSGFSVSHSTAPFPINSVYSATESGSSLGLLASYNSVSHVSTSYSTLQFAVNNVASSIDLGALAAGNALNLRYEVDLVSELTSYGGSASVTFDDPVSTLQLQSVSTVPEPSQGALLVAGVALLAPLEYRRRKRSRRDDGND